MDLIRDAPIGQLIRFLSRGQLFKYPEELPDFVCPGSYKGDAGSSSSSTAAGPVPGNPEKPPVTDDEGDGEKSREPEPDAAGAAGSAEAADAHPYGGDSSQLARPPSAGASSVRTDGIASLANVATARRGSLARVGTHTALQTSATRADLEQQFTDAINAANEVDRPIEPEKDGSGLIVVDWYTTNDPANPQNWSLRRKMFVSTIIYLYTFTFYLGSAIYTSSAEGVMRAFNVGPEVASLGLSMYVLAYGIGPLIFSPLSEIPVIGRNPTYIWTFGIFVLLVFPAALVENIAGLVILRFLQGFFGSPCLATGGASLGDMFSLIKLPYVLSIWAYAATAGPALGPLLSGFSVVAKDWHWSMWELFWLAAPVWILMFLFLPETSADNILLRRAQRLRKATGNPMLKSQGEINQAQLKFKHVLVEALWLPIKIMLLDPSIGFMALYTALIYGIYYSFFEVFPIVYLGYYGFNIGEMGLAFVSIIVGATLGMALYVAYAYYVVERSIRKRGLGPPEERLVPALFASFLLPIGLFMFAWTARRAVHWIAPTIGIGIFTVGIFIVIQCIFLYLPLTYPQYTASLFAGNDFLRSTLAAGTIHFSRPLYINLGVAAGVSMLAGFTCACIVGVFLLWWYGDKLRARSKFAAK